MAVYPFDPAEISEAGLYDEGGRSPYPHFKTPITKMPTEPSCVRWVILMTRLSADYRLRLSQWSYAAKEYGYTVPKADAYTLVCIAVI